MTSTLAGSEVTILTPTRDEVKIKELKFGSSLHNVKVIHSKYITYTLPIGIVMTLSVIRDIS